MATSDPKLEFFRFKLHYKENDKRTRHRKSA
jgi:hypothetical protein